MRSFNWDFDLSLDSSGDFGFNIEGGGTITGKIYGVGTATGNVSISGTQNDVCGSTTVGVGSGSSQVTETFGICDNTSNGSVGFYDPDPPFSGSQF